MNIQTKLRYGYDTNQKRYRSFTDDGKSPQPNAEKRPKLKVKSKKPKIAQKSSSKTTLRHTSSYNIQVSIQPVGNYMSLCLGHLFLF
jgi:hypothetical protein